MTNTYTHIGEEKKREISFSIVGEEKERETSFLFVGNERSRIPAPGKRRG